MDQATRRAGDGHDLEIVLRSRIPIVVVETRDEARVLELLKPLSATIAKPLHIPIFRWSVTEGLRRFDVDLGGSQYHNAQPQEVLKHIRALDKPGIFVLLDFHPYLSEPVHVRLVKDIALGYEKVARTLVLLSHAVELPRELEHLSARLELEMPDREQRRELIEGVAREWHAAHPQNRMRTDHKALELLIDNLGGLSTADARRLARKAIFDDGMVTESDLPALMKAKYELLNRGGVLVYEYDTARFAEVGGLTRLRAWLELRRANFTGAGALDSPKGMLLLGVQGCGKSLAARAVAGTWGVPLLRLDFGAVYSKWHGESERNLRETLRSIEALAPCVLWIDEIEKGVAAGDGDSGTSKRILGAFLTWLAEKKSRVFVVATANDIAALPPELVRKGRFDEIFFVDLPSSAVRAEILALHAKRRGLELDAREAMRLAEQADGFSGAELEQAVVSALYAAEARKEKANAAHVSEELGATRPLSVVMAERLHELRAWAAERTVPAD